MNKKEESQIETKTENVLLTAVTKLTEEISNFGKQFNELTVKLSETSEKVDNVMIKLSEEPEVEEEKEAEPEAKAEEEVSEPEPEPVPEEPEVELSEPEKPEEKVEEPKKEEVKLSEADIEQRVRDSVQKEIIEVRKATKGLSTPQDAFKLREIESAKGGKVEFEAFATDADMGMAGWLKKHEAK